MPEGAFCRAPGDHSYRAMVRRYGYLLTSPPAPWPLASTLERERRGLILTESDISQLLSDLFAPFLRHRDCAPISYEPCTSCALSTHTRVRGYWRKPDTGYALRSHAPTGDAFLPEPPLKGSLVSDSKGDISISR